MKKYKLYTMLFGLTIAVLGLSAWGGAVTMYSMPEKKTVGIVLIVMAFLSTAFLIVEAVLMKGQTDMRVSRLASQISQTERDSLLYFPAPCIIMDGEDKIIWYNMLFSRKVYSDEDAYGMAVSEIMNIDLDEAFSPEGSLICLNKKYYVAKAVHTDSENELAMIYFNDVTEFTELRYEAYQSHNSVIIIVIDNFDELMSNVRESEKAHVVVEIEKLMERFLEGTTAIAKKVSSDKFYVFMEERYLARKIENRFRILEEARQISIGGRSNVTLSIGIGREGKGLEECEKLAKQALELCQGRGGDQAAYRENGEFRFFGGVSHGADNNNRVKIRIFADTLMEIIKPGSIESLRNFRSDDHNSPGFRRVLIMGHRFGDLDSIGSATGLCCALRKIVPECYVVVDREKNLAKALISYIDEHELTNYYITPEDGLSRLDADTLLIVVDTHNPALVESKDMLAKAKNIVVIDHHRRMVNGIEPLLASCLEPGASSAAELVTEIIELWGDRTSITNYAADALLSGIMLDTKYFVMKTGVTTFETAAYLRKLGSDTVAVKQLFANSIETYHVKSDIINSSNLYRRCAIACADGDFGNVRVAASQAADEMLGISGVDASFVLYDQKNGSVNISARSMGKYNVQMIMEALGGGGHMTMAAAQIPGVSVEQAREKLKDAVDEYIKNNAS